MSQNLTAKLLGDPPADLEDRRSQAEQRVRDPSDPVRVRNKTILPRGRPVKKS